MSASRSEGGCLPPSPPGQRVGGTHPTGLLSFFNMLMCVARIIVNLGKNISYHITQECTTELSSESLSDSVGVRAMFLYLKEELML